MERNPFQREAQDLEEVFFAEENRRLLQKLREKSQQEARRNALREVLPNADDAVLDRLLELGIRPETALAVILIPLTLVAWADGAIEPKERDAVLRAAEERGVRSGSPARALLESWLARKPREAVVEAWRRYVRTVASSLDPEERRRMREALLGMARDVAQAAGGFLGLGSKISAAEQSVLQELERALLD